MTTIIHIKQSTLDAMLLIAGKKDIRYYLNGVYLEWNSTLTRAVGCDGHRLAVLNEWHDDNAGAGSIIIPRDVIERLPKRPKNDAIVSITCTGVDDNKRWAIVAGGVVINFAPYDDKYPDWRRVTHGIKTSGEAAGFNIDYLVAFEKAGVILGGGKRGSLTRTRIHHNGRDGAIVTLDGIDGFAGVVMPLREQVGSAGALFPADLTTDVTTLEQLAA
jgi:DNA polymerase III subunit beta